MLINKLVKWKLDGLSNKGVYSFIEHHMKNYSPAFTYQIGNIDNRKDGNCELQVRKLTGISNTLEDRRGNKTIWVGFIINLKITKCNLSNKCQYSLLRK